MTDIYTLTCYKLTGRPASVHIAEVCVVVLAETVEMFIFGNVVNAVNLFIVFADVLDRGNNTAVFYVLDY